jgi:prepilin-type N-terminal cleavage/methylation domain-containing protein
LTQTNGHGFTLIEMLAVLAIIALVAVLVVPRTSAMEGVEFRSAARTLAGAIRITYNSAVVSRLPHRIVFDLEEQSYWVEDKDGKEYAPSASPMLGKRVIPDSLYLKRIQVMDRDCSGMCREYLYFTPGGYVEEASIHLATLDDSRVFSLFTHPMTGRVSIEGGELSRQEWEKNE